MQLRGVQCPGSEVEVGEVAAKGITHGETTTKNPDLDPARGCRQVAPAGPHPVPELPRAAAGPRTAPSAGPHVALLPCGAHVVPAAIRAEGSEEGLLVPVH